VLLANLRRLGAAMDVVLEFSFIIVVIVVIVVTIVPLSYISSYSSHGSMDVELWQV
jgi:hypothetical protein